MGVPNESVKLTTYNSAGQEVQSAEGEATAAEWKRVAVTLAGAAQISYFSISTTKSTASPANSPGLAIDNLSFEKVEEETKKEKEEKEKQQKEKEAKKKEEKEKKKKSAVKKKRAVAVAVAAPPPLHPRRRW